MALNTPANILELKAVFVTPFSVEFIREDTFKQQ